MKILLLGKNGQVGWELSTRLAAIGELTAFDRSQCDLSSPETIPEVIDTVKPDIIINAAAYTAVDKAEEEESLATVVNGSAVAVLAECARKHDALLVHYSTDYVFDGSKQTAYLEDDSPCPINAYGRSKLLGEDAIREQGCQYLIFRTSWVYASRGGNFIRTMLRLAAERDNLSVISDQIGAPTSAGFIADVTVEVLQKLISRPDGTDIHECYHLCASGETSWYGFAKRVIAGAITQGEKMKVTPDQIHAIRSEDYDVPAKRPLNSRLSTDKLRTDFEIAVPDWSEVVDQTVTQIISDNNKTE